jgi:hypothetical protein
MRIFGRKTRTRRTLGSHQIWVFRCWSEQLVGREARRELEEALAHVLRAKASSEAALTIDKHRPSRLTVAGLRCRSPLIKVSINTFPSLLWSRRSKPHQKLTTVARENSNSGEPPRARVGAVPGRSQPPQPSDRRWTTEIRSRDTGSIGLIWAIDPVTNDRRLMKSVDPWASAGGPGPWCRGHILQIFLKENNSINPKNRWRLRILQKHPWTFS